MVRDAGDTPFEFWALGHTQREYGGGPWALITELISIHAPRFGNALDRIEVTIYCNGSLSKDSRGFPPLNETPSVRFGRKKRRLEIVYPSAHFSPDDAFGLYLPHLTRAHLKPAIDDLFAATEWGLKKRITTKDDFDVSAFLIWLQSHRDTEFSSDDELRRAVESASNAERERRAQMDPWERLDIDWGDMHPKARSILDDPEDWSGINEFSPHGNDTGADILIDWPEYKDLTCREAARSIGWSESEIDLGNELFWRDWVQINLALAFGHIKKNGKCDRKLASEAHGVLAEEMRRASELTDWEHRHEFLKRMERYSDILQRFF